ncbi:MAG: cytochrome c-type biogenesis protein, partial [Sneathiellaceae bacterium]
FCHNQTLADSDASRARSLRGNIRALVAAGRSDSEVRDYLVARYGQWILMRPPVNWRNALLWLAPALILLAGIGVILLRRRGSAVPAVADRPLDAAEQARLAALLERDGT